MVCHLLFHLCAQRRLRRLPTGSFTRSDATLKVTRLRPGHCYGIRVVTTNAAGNPSYSSIIQVQTPPSEGHRSSKLLSSFENTYPKRTGSRRISQPLFEKATSPTGTNRTLTSQQDDGQKKLQRQLDDLRRDVEEAEAQLKEDRDDAEAQISRLSSQRDTLKRQVDDREKESTELRKKVGDLEKAAKNSQRKKSERERRVKEKLDQRQKMKDDMVRWEAEGVKIAEELEGAEQSKTEIRDSHETKLQEAQKSFESIQAEVVKLEEELRDMGIKVRKLEEEREQADQKQNEEETQAELRQQEEAEAHETKVHEYQHHYHALWRLNAEANARLQDASEQLQHYLDLRNREPSKFSPIPGLDYPVNAFQQPRRPQRGHLLSMNRPGHPTYTNSANPSPTSGNAFPFPPLGTTLRSGSQFSPADPQQLTAVTPLSPGSDVLLPSDLLGDEDDPNMVMRAATSHPRFGSIPHIYRPPSRTSASAHDPQSPQSIDSKSPSLISSPHESRSNIANLYGDDETQSLGSANSPFSPTAQGSNPSSSRKIGSLLWGFNRQRDKAPLSELPALGSLKSKETQSFPSNLDEAPDTPPSGGRKGASIWPPMTGPFNFLNRGAGKNPETEVLASGPTRKGRRGILGTKIHRPDPLMTSSRPSSTYSFDQVISQPVLEGQYGWQTPDSTRPRGSTLAGPWSHNQSRRTSVAQGSTSNLSIGSTPLDPADDYPSPYNFGAKATPAPIGTERFHIGKRSTTPKLNPNAPSFTTRLFNRGDSKKPKTEKSADNLADRDKEKAKSKDSDKGLDAHSKNSSPPVSRLSHDAPSITTSASIGESHDSLEPSTSASHSEGTAPLSSSVPKESLMQRITRKSSSSKFSVPWSNRSGKGGTSRKEPSTPGDLDEDPDGDYLGKGSTAESATPERGVGRGNLSWSRVMGKGRKRSELNMSDAGERSSEAGGETEDDG
jgi:hypothetical protein